MVGITSYAGYIPRYRLNRMTVYASMGWFNPAVIMNAAGEKAVANYDEDAVTMAVEAGIRCLQGFDPSRVEAVYLATTTAPFRERQCANLVAGAVCAGEEVRSADFCGSLKAGTTALLSALEFVAAGGPGGPGLCRRLPPGKMGSVQEMVFGDAAAALLVGREEVMPSSGLLLPGGGLCGPPTGRGIRFDRQWEERWIRDMGYEKLIPAAVTGLCRTDLQPADFDRFIYPCYYGGARKKIQRSLGVDSAKVQGELLQEVGDSGAAHPLLMLAKALEEAKPGDKLLVVSFGSGCDALYFQVTEAIESFAPRRRVSDSLEESAPLDSYLKYLVWRGMGPVEIGMRGEEDRLTRWSMVWRSRQAILGLQGTLCRACGTQQYPPQRVCTNPDCGAVDQMDPVYLAGKGGRIFSFTSDMLAASLTRRPFTAT